MPQTITLPFKLGDTGSSFGGSFDVDGRPSRGLPSLKIREDPTTNGGEIRGPILGFQITDNCYAQMNRKDARG